SYSSHRRRGSCPSHRRRRSGRVAGRNGEENLYQSPTPRKGMVCPIQEPGLPPPGLFASTKLTFCNYISGVFDGVHKLSTDWRNHWILHSTTDRLNSSSRCHS